MRATLRLLPLLLALSGVSAGAVNLSTMDQGGIPSALDSSANARFWAQSAADGKPDTAWVSGASLPVWLRVEWRFPVTVEAVAFRPATLTEPKLGAIGRYAIEVAVPEGWRTVASGDATAARDEVRHALPAPVITTAVRLRIDSAAALPVGVAELSVEGPKPSLPNDYESNWKGSWLWAEPSLRIPNRQAEKRFFRRVFTVADPAAIREAWLAAAGFDSLRLWLNNRLLVEQPPLPAGTKRLPQPLAVPAGTLVAGENVLAAEVADYAEVGSRGLLAELAMVDAAGQRTVIASDDQWLTQADPGPWPDWRTAGFKDARWVPAKPVAGPGGRWHWLWGVPHPALAPTDRLRLTRVELPPPPLRPGTTVDLKLTFSGAAKTDYAVIARLGERSPFSDHDYELWGGSIAPEVGKTSAWAAGEHTVTLALPLPAEAPRRTPVTIRLTRPDTEAGVETSLAGWTADAYGVHGVIDIDRGAPAAAPGKEFPRCEVAQVNGAVSLVVDGRPVPAIWWASAYGNDRRYARYPSSGIHLVRPLINGTAISAPGAEAESEEFWYRGIDQMLSTAVSLDPDVRLMPVIALDPHPQWLFDHPEQQMISGRGQQVIRLAFNLPEVGQVRSTFMSTAWRRDGAEGLRRLVKHLRAQPYADHVIGLWFFAGRAGENYWGGNEFNLFVNAKGEYDSRPRDQWDAGDFSMAARLVFRQWLLAKYRTVEALRAAWRRPDAEFDQVLDPAAFRADEITNLLTWADKPADSGIVRDPTTPGVGTLPMDYYQCMADAMTDTFAAWGRAVKEASDGRLITGCYNAYAVAQLSTAVPGFFGHTATERAVRSPWLDGFSSPIDYERRKAGTECDAFNVTDSLGLNTKLHVYEFDSRTYLASIGPRTDSLSETLEVWKRDVGHALCRNSGWWWYEFAEAQNGARSKEWFDDPDILQLAGQAKRAYDASLRAPDRSSVSQIAVFFHGPSVATQDLFTSPAVDIPLVTQMLWTWLPRVGAPFDLFCLADLPKLAESGKLRQYKLCLFLNPFTLTAEERGWVDRCKADGRTLAWFWAPGIAQTGEQAGLSVERVAALTGIPGLRALNRAAEPTLRITAADHPLTTGLAGRDEAPRAFGPGAMWARFGNVLKPAVYVDPAADSATKVLASWVLDGQLHPELGALAVRDQRRGDAGWASVYSAVPSLTPDVLRNLARFAGVHIYRDGGEIFDAGRNFVALHTGAQAVKGKLSLPRKCDVTDVFSGQTVGRQTDQVEVDVAPYHSVVYWLGDPAALR